MCKVHFLQIYIGLPCRKSSVIPNRDIVVEYNEPNLPIIACMCQESATIIFVGKLFVVVQQHYQQVKGPVNGEEDFTKGL